MREPVHQGGAKKVLTEGRCWFQNEDAGRDVRSSRAIDIQGSVDVAAVIYRHRLAESPLRGLAVSRYFFTVQRPEGAEYDDGTGTNCPTDTAARQYAERIIRELKKAGSYNEPGLIMIVRDAHGKTVFSIPFSDCPPCI
jgi:hypothetical protein